MRVLELNGGRVEGEGDAWRFALSPVSKGYANAQIDDLGSLRRGAYPWRPGACLQLRARFSHPAGQLRGTAGFGFWNAPFREPSLLAPALPQCAWFFYASAPNDLPLALEGPGRGWFVSTLDASPAKVWALAPLGPFLALALRHSRIRDRLWPWLRRRLGISFGSLATDITAWHDYSLHWSEGGCRFGVDGQTVLETPHSPAGPQGFVCWMDNRYLIASPTGRLKWGILRVGREQWMEVEQLEIGQASVLGAAAEPAPSAGSKSGQPQAAAPAMAGRIGAVRDA
ncbi:MAG: hypothetical protein ACRDHL_07965 [Candidatus Promineifilaceae bacterium]